MLLNLYPPSTDVQFDVAENSGQHHRAALDEIE